MLSQPEIFSRRAGLRFRVFPLLHRACPEALRQNGHTRCNLQWQLGNRETKNESKQKQF